MTGMEDDMPIKKMVLGAAIAIIAIAGLLTVTGAVTHAQGQSTSDYALLGKLDEILKGQKEIMEDLALMREELRVIKIRVTQQQ